VAVFVGFIGKRLQPVAKIVKRIMPVGAGADANLAHGAEQFIGIGAALDSLVKQSNKVE
jgi:hypothetical protein